MDSRFATVKCENLLSKNLKLKIYRIIILPFVLCGCETWSLKLREEHRLNVNENRMLRRIFGSKSYEVTGEWKKLHNVELHDLYSSPNTVRAIKSRIMRWEGYVARIYRVLVGKPDGKRPLRSPWRIWEDKIKTNL
jgi:hypothetical protein